MSYGQPNPQFTPHAVPAKPKRRLLPWIIAAVVLLFLGLCIAGIVSVMATGGNSSKGQRLVTPLSTPAPASRAVGSAPLSTPSPTAEPVTSAAEYFEAGTYQVGRKSSPDGGTIKPGTYTLITADHCYWERVRGFSGDFNEIIANGNLDANGDKPATGVLTIRKSDKGVTLEGSCILGQKGGLK